MSASDIRRRDLLRLPIAAALASAASAEDVGVGPLYAPPDPAFHRVTLEVSLKPFRAHDEDSIRAVCEQIFRSWAPLLRRTKSIAVMLWSADGSEILEYRGRIDDAFDWARYLGDANPPKTPPADDPERKGAHGRNWLYMDNPPQVTYGTLRRIVAALKQVGSEVTGKPVVVGATFDPGGEFAQSTFKFVRHAEIATGGTRGPNTWVNCTAKLKADPRPYAAFPQGIPEGTSFGAFLGGQSQRFLTDLGFDYIWFSNGLGFSLSPWNATGPLFDGKSFDARRAPEVRDAILSFWRDFRSQCKSFPIETRGSNLTVGADLSASASPVREIYRSGFHVIAPPNSPWAALDGDFGLEIVGYLSRISELPPENIYPFRFYTHDPWWMNSPWLDRYGREPHDIYLPLSLARVNGDATITRPAYLEFLTIDNSFGRMPEKVPNEVIPHILLAMDDYSDAPGAVTWIYPFDEYHDMTFGPAPRLNEVFFGDWFLRGAVNNGFPLNTVVSTRQFAASYRANPSYYDATILLAYAPVAAGDLERLLIEALNRGQNVMLYGPLDHAGPVLRRLLHFRQGAPLSGELTVETSLPLDRIEHGEIPKRIHHRGLISAGPIDAIPPASTSDVRVLATASDGQATRVIALSRRNAAGAGSGTLAWVRGSFCCSIGAGRLPLPDDPRQYFQGEALMRMALSEFGYSIHFSKPAPETRSPLVLMARHKNGYFLSCYSPSTTASVDLRFPQGAPILVGAETWFENGHSRYTPPRAWHKEVRCLVDQVEASEISCVEAISEFPFIERRLALNGLKNATVHFFPENDRRVIMEQGDLHYYNQTSLPYERADSGKRLIAKGITGRLTISW